MARMPILVASGSVSQPFTISCRSAGKLGACASSAPDSAPSTPGIAVFYKCNGLPSISALPQILGARLYSVETTGINVRMHNSPPANFLVVGLGEALFDCFDDHVTLGGAPINFAVHVNQLLQPLGGTATVVSRIGKDALGRQLLQELAAHGLSLDNIQQDEHFPTGSVQVRLDATGQPTYDIASEVAWDHLTSTKNMTDLAAHCHAVCFGTLAQRSATSRQAIQKFLQAAHRALRIFDVNLRQDFYDADVVEKSLRLANVVKLNQEELQLTCRLLDLNSAAGSGNETENAFTICQTYELNALALTRGDLGTLIFTKDRCFEGTAGHYPSADNADSVGAGDGCCAAFACGLLLGWPWEHVVDMANRIGAFVAAQPGATPDLPAELIAAAQQHARTDLRAPRPDR